MRKQTPVIHSVEEETEAQRGRMRNWRRSQSKDQGPAWTPLGATS